MPNSPRLDNTLLRVSTRLAQQYDIKLAPLLQECQLPPDVPDNPCRTVTLAQEQRFHELLISLLRIPGLGLSIGQTFSHHKMTPFSLLVATAKNLNEATGYIHWLTRACSPNLTYQQTLSEEVSHNRIIVQGAPASIRTFLVERLLSTTFCPVNSLLKGQHLPLRLDLDYPDPGYGQLYEELFQCPVLFDQPVTQILYPTKHRHLTFSSHDPRVHKAMRSLCLDLHQDLQSGLSVREQVTRQLNNQLLSEVSFDTVARALGHSVRSLRRHLAAENTGFQEILNEHRLALAMDKLRHSRAQVAQVALFCGFADARSFIRAFQRWTGLTPSEFRKLQQGN